MSGTSEHLNNTPENDLEFVTGGAKIDSAIMNQYKQTCNTQRCDCGEYEPAISKCNINICDNCIWARAPRENTTVTYCTRQKLN